MEQINIEEYFNSNTKDPIIDVRSPLEFQKGHIPGAVNLPLFSDEERAKIGTLYKQNSPEIALLHGLDMVGPKMSQFIKFAKKLNAKSLIVHCWRGGKRSESMAWLLKFAGFEVKIMQGGYKSFRNYVVNSIFEIPLKCYVLGGKTGMGKSHILQEMALQNEQIIDLERLACHKGSAFGHLGEQKQPTNEQFENNLAYEILNLDQSKRTWVENESRTIGAVAIPLAIWDKMKIAPLLRIEVDDKIRMQNILNDYGDFTKEELISSFQKIEKKLGGQNLKLAETSLNEGNIEGAVLIAMKYYDKTYDYSWEQSQVEKKHFLNLYNSGISECAKQIIEYANNYISNS